MKVPNYLDITSHLFYLRFLLITAIIRNMMLANNSSKKTGFTLIELTVVIAIIVTMVVVLRPMFGTFAHRRTLEVTALKFLGDLRQAQQFSRVQRDGYKYYGVQFANWVSPVFSYYTIVRFEPSSLEAPFEASGWPVTFIKSGFGGEELPEETRFPNNIRFTTAAEGDTDFGPLGGDEIVFTPEGSVTDGENLVTDITGDGRVTITLQYVTTGDTKSIEITPLTGHLKIIDLD